MAAQGDIAGKAGAWKRLLLSALGLSAAIALLVLGGRAAIRWQTPSLAEDALAESRRVREGVAPVSLRDLLAGDEYAAPRASQDAGGRQQASAGYLYTRRTWPEGAELENLRAELALRGVAAGVVEVETRRRPRRYRLRLGPLYTASERNNARQELAKFGIESSAQRPQERP